jgi:hypothetical protein
VEFSEIRHCSQRSLEADPQLTRRCRDKARLDSCTVCSSSVNGHVLARIRTIYISFVSLIPCITKSTMLDHMILNHGAFRHQRPL